MPDVTDILEEFSEKLGMIREIAGMMAYTDWDELTNRKGAGSLRYIGEFILETLSEFEESMKGAAEEDYYDFHCANLLIFRMMLSTPLRVRREQSGKRPISHRKRKNPVGCPG